MVAGFAALSLRFGLRPGEAKGSKRAVVREALSLVSALTMGGRMP